MRNRIGLSFGYVLAVFFLFLCASCCTDNHERIKGPNDRKPSRLKVIDYLATDTSYPFNVHEFAIVRRAREHPEKVRDCLYVFEATKRAAKLFDFKGITKTRLIALLGSPDRSVVTKKSPKRVEELEFEVIDMNTMYCRQCSFIVTLVDSRVTNIKFEISDE